MVGLASLLIYPIIIDSEFLIPLLMIAFFCFILFIRNKCVIVNVSFFYLLLLEICILLYMFSSYEKPAQVSFLGELSGNLFYYNMFLTSCVGFAIFNLGLLYGYNVISPLVNLSTLVLCFTLTFCCYILIAHGSAANSLLFGSMVGVLLPYIVLSINSRQLKKNNFYVVFLVICFLFLFLLVVSNRAALIGVACFYIFYSLHSLMTGNRLARLFYFPLYVLLLFGMLLTYSVGVFEFLNDYSISVFSKAVDSGRPLIWAELLNIIKEDLLWGKGINQSSSFLVSETVSWRNLSSHNTFIELFLRGGVVLAALFFCMIYSLFLIYTFKGSSDCQYCRLGASSLFSFIFIASFAEVGLSINIVINCFLWLFFGVSSGACLRHLTCAPKSA